MLNTTIVVFNPLNLPIKALLCFTKCVFKHKDLLMFDLKLKGLAQAEIIKKSVILFWPYDHMMSTCP